MSQSKETLSASLAAWSPVLTELAFLACRAELACTANIEPGRGSELGNRATRWEGFETKVIPGVHLWLLRFRSSRCEPYNPHPVKVFPGDSDHPAG